MIEVIVHVRGWWDKPTSVTTTDDLGLAMRMVANLEAQGFIARALVRL